MTTSHVARSSSSSIGGRIAVAIGFLAHAVVGVFVFSSGLMMPAWAVVALLGIWAVALAMAIRRRSRPLWVLMTPVVVFAIWYLVGWAGETYLGWTG